MAQDWPKKTLHNAMMEALIHNRVDTVQLLLENGVNMQEFLTIGRLEELYNNDQGPPNTLYYIVRDVVKIRAGYRYKLPHIGMAIEKLMANGFRSHYTSAQFRHKYNEYKNKIKESQRHIHHLQVHSPSKYHRCRSEFFAERGTKVLPSSASYTNFGSIQPNEANQKKSITSQYPTISHQNNPANLTTIPTISGNRALSNHLLWRTTYRRENNPSAINKYVTTKSPPLTQSRSAYQFGTSNDTINANTAGINDAIAYATEADESLNLDGEQRVPDFRYPFSDLLIWAVLTKRHQMALCMWQHGEESMAKALVACRLYKSLAKEAAEDYLEVEVCEELKKYAEEFRQLSLDLLDHCHKQDDAQTLQLLTYELNYWGQETCLSLAVIVNNKQFLAHPCCQILLADLWHGGLRIRSNSNLKVIFGILFPPSIFLLEFKSREELMLQPQTAAEHQDDINESSSSESSYSSSTESASEEEVTDSDITPEKRGGGSIANRRRTSHGSSLSLNFTSIFQSKRKRNRNHPSLSAPANGTDLESGKNKNLDLHGTKERHRRTKKRIRASSVLSNHDANRTEPGGVITMAAQSTMETAFPLAGSQIHYQSPLSSPSRFKASAPASIQPLNVDTNEANSQQQYEQPHFILGSIEEDSTGNDCVSPSGASKTGRNCPNATTITIKNLNTNDTTSPRDREAKNEEIVSPKTEFSTPTRWDKKIGLANSLDQLNRHTINGGYVPKGIPLPEGVTLNKKRQIKFKRKLYEFFVAPITTFWAWTISFVIFLSILTYVLLIRTPSRPTLLEWYLLAYVVAFGIETSRKFVMSEPKKLSEKIEYFFGNYWNFLTTVAIIGFIVGFIFRLNPSTSKTIGRIILAVDSVLWTVKLLDFLGVFQRFGPYITMAGKMIMNMSSIIVMLGISLLGFGLARQSITYPNEEWHWLLLRNVFYKPYFMLYGEVYADEIDTCGDEAWDEHLDKNVSIANAWTHRDDRDRELACVPGHWIPPILMTIFLLIANILLISMLIAIFNNIFESTNKISQQIWLFQRYRQVMEYEATPFLPPPFTPIYHVYMILKYLNYRSRICICFSPKFRQYFGQNCFCFCTRRRNKSCENEANCDEEEETDKKEPPPLPNNAYDQRRTFQEGPRGRNQEQLALFDFSLKLFLTDDQIEKLHEFEQECMKDLALEKEFERNRTNEERLHRTCERTEMILSRVNDILSKDSMTKGNIRELEARMEVMENKQTEILGYLRQLNSVMPLLLQSIQSQPQKPDSVSGSSSLAPSRFKERELNNKISSRSEESILAEKSPNDNTSQENKRFGNKTQLRPSSSVDPSTFTQRTSTTPLLPPEMRQQRAQTYGSTYERHPEYHQ